MFGVSLPELLVIFAVALIVFGPERLPEIARTIGKVAADLRRASDQVRREFYNSVYKPADDVGKRIGQEVRNLTTIPVQPHPEISDSALKKEESKGENIEKVERQSSALSATGETKRDDRHE